MKNLKILISESVLDRETLQIFKKYFPKISFLPCDGYRIVEIIERTQPDIVILEMFMPQMDAVEIINKIRKNATIILPKFIVISSFGRPSLEKEALSVGVSHFMVKPVTANNIIEKIQRITHFSCENLAVKKMSAPVFKLHSQNMSSFELQVTEILHQIGVPAHIKGYHFLRNAILMYAEIPDTMTSITKQIYPEVAKNFHTEPARVERAIRHAIEIAWDRGDTDVLNSYFGYTIHTSRGKPTNSEFIAMMADKIKLQIRVAS